MKCKKTVRIACISVAAVCVGYLSYYYTRLYQANRINEALQSAAPQAESCMEDTTATAEPQVTAKPVNIPVDFQILQQQNPDIYAWIELPCCEEGYPVLQHPTDDSYYLEHSVEGKYGLPGALYTERVNAKDFSDFNTVIYGHNMKNGTMFGKLKKYRDPSYWEGKRDIVIYTADQKRVYRIFAAVVYPSIHVLNTYENFELEGNRELFLQSIMDTHDINSHVLDDIRVTTESQILTLSTCIGGKPNNRYLIEAVYIGDE